MPVSADGCAWPQHKIHLAYASLSHCTISGTSKTPSSQLSGIKADSGQDCLLKSSTPRADNDAHKPDGRSAACPLSKPRIRGTVEMARVCASTPWSQIWKILEVLPHSSQAWLQMYDVSSGVITC